MGVPPIAAGLIAAAGRGRRMGGARNKVLSLLDGVPILAWTLSALSASQYIGPLVVVVGADDVDDARAILQGMGLDGRVVVGGEARAESVRAGLAAARELGPELVAVHDGARPFVTPQVIERTVVGAAEFGAMAAAVPVSDTIKRVDHADVVLETPIRASLRAMQTPQTFNVELLHRAYSAAGRNADAMTDDCEVVERFGHPVRLSEGDQENIKVTYQIDRAVAEAIAARREKPRIEIG